MQGIEKELITFAVAVFSGAIIRLVYRCLSIFREIVKHSLVLIGIEDLMFWVCAGFYLFVQIYQTNSGSIRWHFILGVVSGAVLMSVLVKKVRNFSEFFSRKSVDKQNKKR